MTRQEQIDLIKKHAPIMWLHENEAFVPLDCGAIFDVASLWRDDKPIPKNQQPKSFADKVFLQNTQRLSFVFDDLDMRNFAAIPKDLGPGIDALGPSAIAEVARQRYGWKYGLGGAGGTDRVFGPKYYGRVTQNVQVTKQSDDPFSKWADKNDPDVFGTYTLIEYFYYFLFNDSWNMHESDWDSLTELYIREDRQYMVTHMHHCRWLARWNSKQPGISQWCDKWNRRKNFEIGDAYVMDGHPYIFVARGAHGAYPTPGFSVHGLNVPGLLDNVLGLSDDILGDTDQRVIGRRCIIPSGIDAQVKKSLRDSGLRTNKLELLNWLDPELVSEQPWVNFRGRWGSDLEFSGWDGPRDPPATRPPNMKGLVRAYQEGYTGRDPLRIFRSWHGVRPSDIA